MDNNQFKVPPVPPRAPSFPAQPAGHTTVGANALPADDFATRFKLPTRIYQTKIMAGILGGSAVVGLILGAMLFGGSAPAPCPPALAGIVRNPDIRQSLPRCGTVNESDRCAFYIVNHSRNDKLAENFVPEVMKQTGREGYLIQVDNKNYMKTRIPPGYIVQIQVPPLH